MSARDAEFIYEEGSGHRETLVGCYLIDATAGTPSTRSLARLRDWIRPRLGGADFLTRRLRRVPLELGLPSWVPAVEMELSDHLHIHEVDGGWDELRQLLGEIAARPIDLSRPPWALHAIHGGRDVDGLPVTTLVLTVHHCAIDGMGFREFEALLLSADPGEPVDDHAVRSRRPVHPVESVARAVLGAPRTAFRFARHVRSTRSDIEEVDRRQRAGELVVPEKTRPATRFNAPVAGQTDLRVTSFALADMHAARSAAPGATINDVLLTVVGGAIHQQLESVGEEPDGALAALVPISLRIRDSRTRESRADGYTDRSSNKLVTGTVDLHSDVADPAARLAAVASSSRKEKDRWQYDRFRRAHSRMDEAPAALLALRGWVHRNARIDDSAPRLRNTMISNLPAPAGAPQLDGVPLHSVFGVLPPVDGQRLRHLLSINGDRAILSITSDGDVLPDPTAYIAEIHSELAALMDAGS